MRLLEQFRAFIDRAPSPVPRRGGPVASLGFGAAVEYETSIINPDGSVAACRKRKRNLILDQGLNNVATQLWPQLFRYCAVGTGTNPIKRDSGAITFTRSGNTVSASAGFFESADVGRLLKFDSGPEMYITAYTDTQNVTVATSGTLAASEGTIWYVNRTGLQTESARTGSVSNGASDNETTFATDTYTHKRTFLFPAVGGAVTYREIGWSHNASAGANLFGMDILPGEGDSLIAGQQYKVVVRLLVTLSPVAITAAGDVGIGGYNTAGNICLQYLGNPSENPAFSSVNSDGSTKTDSGGGRPFGLEPAGQPVIGTEEATYSLNSGPSTGSTTGINGTVRASSPQTYVADTFYREFKYKFGVLEANATHYGVSFGTPTNNFGTGGPRALSQRFTTNQIKDNLHTLEFTLRLSWGRTLVN